MPGIATMLQIGFTPAPPPVVEAVEEIVVESTLETSSAVRIRLGIAQNDLGDWRFLQEDLFRPLAPMTVRVGVGTVPVPEALITGYLSQQHITYADVAGSSTLEISGLDATLLMNLQEKVMPWPNLPDGAIAAAIFGQYALLPIVQPTAPTLIEPEGTTMQRGTDLRFLQRLAKRNGFDVYVQPEPLTGVDQGFFRPRQTLGLPQAVLNVHMGSETNVGGFRVRYDMSQPTGVVAAGLDTTTKAPQPALAPVALQPPMGVEPTLLRVLPPPVVRPADTGAMRTSELQALAQGIADRSSYAVVAEGEAGPDVGVLRPGGLVAVRGLGRLLNGLYLLTRVRHRITDGSYVQQFEARRNAVTMTGAEPYVDL
jgi:phage protein D